MWICFCLLFYGRSTYAVPEFCDPSHNHLLEGNHGETSAFPWLGVLRVRLFEGSTFRLAVTGIVLVKEGYAICSAHDVAKVSRKIMTSDSRAMFIPTADTPWFCRVKDYMTHPEYEFSTMNTVALLELDPGDDIRFPMKPICWPAYSYNASSELYAIGFTDEHKLLEKTVHKLQYVELELCKEFYSRAGLEENKMDAPLKYICGFAASNKGNCLWDNGMVMASNSSGYWKLLGFGVQGPGCSAPARFIDMMAYFPWIETATDLYEINDYRRSAFGTGFKKNRSALFSDIPLHLRLRPGHRKSEDIGEPAKKNEGEHFKYPFDTETVQTRYFTVEKIEDGARIWAENITLPYKYGECSNPRNRLVYADDTKLVAKGMFGTATYKVTAYDLHELKFICIEMQLKGRTNGTARATIYYRLEVDNMEGTANTGYDGFGDTPEDLLKTLYVKKGIAPPPKPSLDDWDPLQNPKLKPQFVQDRNYVLKIPNINILLRLKWKDTAHFRVTIYSPASAMTTSTPTSSTFWTSRNTKISMTTTKLPRRMMVNDKTDTVQNETKRIKIGKIIKDVKEDISNDKYENIDKDSKDESNNDTREEVNNDQKEVIDKTIGKMNEKMNYRRNEKELVVKVDAIMQESDIVSSAGRERELLPVCFVFSFILIFVILF